MRRSAFGGNVHGSVLGPLRRSIAAQCGGLPSSLRHTVAVSAALFLFVPGERAFAECVSPDAGTVTCSGTDPDGLTIGPPPPPGPDVVLDVEPGATVNGAVLIDDLSSLRFNNHGQVNGNITVTNNGDFWFDQNGTFGGTTLSVTGAGSNELLVRSGRSVNTVAMTGARNRVDNFGVLNNAVTLDATSSNTVVNRTGAAINTLTLIGPSNNIDNDGLFNQGLAFSNGHGAGGLDNVVLNRANGVINGINSTGGSFDSVDNSGVINGSVNLGAGNDEFVNRARRPTATSISATATTCSPWSAAPYAAPSISAPATIWRSSSAGR